MILNLDFLKNSDIDYDISIIPIDKLPLNPKLVDSCIVCNNYNLSANCPPFSKIIDFKIYNQCLAFKISILKTDFINNDILYFKKLLDLGVFLEKKLLENQFKNAKAFCGNSCKTVLCFEFKYCSVLNNKKCRCPDLARASISSIGVDVEKLFNVLNWNSINKLSEDNKDFIDICGVILF